MKMNRPMMKTALIYAISFIAICLYRYIDLRFLSAMPSTQAEMLARAESIRFIPFYGFLYSSFIVLVYFFVEIFMKIQFTIHGKEK